jgi:hypothetical protein
VAIRVRAIRSAGSIAQDHAQHGQHNGLPARQRRITVDIPLRVVLRVLAATLGVVLGAAVYGLSGAFVAVPVAGGLQVVLAHLLRVEDTQQTSAHREVQGANQD